MKKNVLIIGAGAVGSVVAHKCFQNNETFASVCLCSRTLAKCEAIITDIRTRQGTKPGPRLRAFAVNAYDTEALSQLIEQTHSDIVINVCTAFVNMSVMNACLATGTAYIDTAVHEDAKVLNAPYPWYANYEWKKRRQFESRGLTAILGAGFDPGVVNAYCAYAQKHEFDAITSIDILDVNDGRHGRFFSTNFDPEINLREVIEDVGCLEDGQWRTYPHHSRHMHFDFPEIGHKKVFLMGHDEVHSLSVNLPNAKTIRFWMGFDEHYLNCLNVLKNVGLLNHQAVTTADGRQVIPLHVLKACLPNPASLAKDYSGRTCIGTLIRGVHNEREKEMFIYNLCEHQQAYADTGSQAIAFTAGVPPVAAAVLIAKGQWDVKTMVNIEQLDPQPFLSVLAHMGLPTSVRRTEQAGQQHQRVLCA